MFKIERVALARNLPIILCGDFNSEPSSAVYELMGRNHVQGGHPDLQQLMDVYNSLELEHNIAFASAYASVFGSEPEYTNYTGNAFLWVLETVSCHTHTIVCRSLDGHRGLCVVYP